MGNDFLKPAKNQLLKSVIHAVKYLALCLFGTNIYWNITLHFVLAYAYLGKFPWQIGVLPWVVGVVLFIGYVIFLYFFLKVIDFVLGKIFKLKPRIKLRKTILIVFVVLSIIFIGVALLSMNTTQYSDIEVQISPSQ